MINADKTLRLFESKSGAFWERQREKNALALFHEVVRRVPAYKEFLKRHGIKPASIKRFKDFQRLPTVSKKTYLRKFPLEKVCWDGTLAKPLVFTSTSGSTGDPFYFPRGHKLDWDCSVVAEMFLKNTSLGEQGPTLFIDCLGMGVWIGGLIMYQAFELAGRRLNHPLSILTPGINKAEIYKALKLLAPKFKQVILMGYAPLIKDIVDSAPSEGINLKKLNIRFMFAAEAFPEKFRDYLKKKTNLKNLCLDTLNIYGTADIGAMAWETPTSILIRRLAMKNAGLFEDVFSSIKKTPTLAQYNPLAMTFEAQDGEILLTGNNTIPLIRYAIGDHRGVLSFAEMDARLKKHGINLTKEAKALGIKDIYRLPFVYVYERNDFSTTLYGLQIYPETVREALLDKPLNKALTGKFTMLTRFDRKQNQYLEINLELQKGKHAKPSVKKNALHAIVTNLMHKNSEYKHLHQFIGEKALPRLVFWPAEDPLYFRPGVKQKWVKK